MTSEYWLWAVGYVAAPLVMIAAVRGYLYLRHGDAVHPFKGESPLFSAVAAVLLLTLWPVMVPVVLLDEKFKVVDRLCGGLQRTARDDRVLLEVVTVEEAEASGKVVDPLHRAPDLPFGHLNGAWNVFLAKRRMGYRLKRFTVPANERNGNDAPPAAQGFAWVKWGTVKSDFLCEWGC
jgi:hypothetical protein